MATQASEVVNKRTGIGAGIGALVGGIFAGPVGALVGALAGGGIAHASGDTGTPEMTARKQVIYTRAMESMKDPRELEKLATAFHGEGFTAEAAMLRKRAKLRALDPQAKANRRQIFRQAMASDDVDKILRLAGDFEDEGAIDAAKALKEHGEAVRAAHQGGKSSKPMKQVFQKDFADKLQKALEHFGPYSKTPDAARVRQAAANLIASRGKQPTEALVAEVIKLAINAMPRPSAAAAETETADEGAAEEQTDTEEAAEAGAAIPAAPEGAPSDEPTVVGPPARAPAEPEQGNTAGAGTQEGASA